MSGPNHDLDRFVTAQQATYAQALAELRAGLKHGHWMWFIFPQMAGLGRSETARHYAIASLVEARAYLAHPLLGERLREAVLAIESSGRTDMIAVFGAIDAAKLRSSLTLFSRAAGAPNMFAAALDMWFEGEDPLTLRLLEAEAG